MQMERLIAYQFSFCVIYGMMAYLYGFFGVLKVGRRLTHSGIYLLPNLFTTSSLFAAFYSIVASLKNHFHTAVIAIFIGMICDGLDGRIARLTNTQTDFGAEYDSLSDMVSFGVAPALLLYSWNLQTLGKFGWLVAFMFTAAVALRLARFNTQLDKADKRYFQGLACPAGAAFAASWVLICHHFHWHWSLIPWVTLLITICCSLLMVSNIRYHSFKQIDLKGKISFMKVILLVLLFIAIALNPSIFMFLATFAYALSGPIQTLYMRQKVRRLRRRVT